MFVEGSILPDTALGSELQFPSLPGLFSKINADLRLDEADVMTTYWNS